MKKKAIKNETSTSIVREWNHNAKVDPESHAVFLNAVGVICLVLSIVLAVAGVLTLVIPIIMMFAVMFGGSGEADLSPMLYGLICLVAALIMYYFRALFNSYSYLIITSNITYNKQIELQRQLSAIQKDIAESKTNPQDSSTRSETTENKGE